MLTRKSQKMASEIDHQSRYFILKFQHGGRTRIRTLDPLIKTQQITSKDQAHFDISSVRSGTEPEGKLENVETEQPYNE